MYKYIQVAAKIAPPGEVMTQEHAAGILKEYELAMAAPKLLEALKQAQKALLFSRPVGSITPEIEEHHKAVHQRTCDILVELKELE